MTQKNLRYLTADQRSMTYADPDDVSSTLRVANDRQIKKMNGIQLLNTRPEFIRNWKTKVTVGDQVAVDAQSIRVTFSGTTANIEKMKAEWAILKANIDAVLDDSLAGFPTKTDAPLVNSLT